MAHETFGHSIAVLDIPLGSSEIPSSQRFDSAPMIPHLTDREQAVLLLGIAGDSEEETAHALEPQAPLSVKTVDVYRAHIKKKYIQCGLVPENSTFGEVMFTAIKIGSAPVPDKPPINIDYLSQREREVLPLIARGLSNSQIADILSVCAKTIEKHKEHVMAKTDATKRDILFNPHLLDFEHNAPEQTSSE